MTLRPLDIIYIFPTVVSLICSFLSIIFIARLPVSSSNGGTRELEYTRLIKRSQNGMLYGAILYHIGMIPTHYVDILVSEANKVHFWDGENFRGWLVWIPLIGTNLGLVNGITWAALLWSKILFANSLQTNISPLLNKVLATSFIAKANSILHLVILTGAIVIPAVCRNDGQRIAIWSSIINNFFFVLDFTIVIPLLVSLIDIYREITSQPNKSKKTDVLAPIKRIIVLCVFVAILCPVAAYFNSASSILKYPARIMSDFSKDEVCSINTKIYGDCNYQSSHITISHLLYSFTGILVSVPFLLRKDFFQIIFNTNRESKDITKNEPRTAITGFDTSVNVENSTKEMT